MKASSTSLRITQREIAERLGVGLSTVSMALRNDPRITEARRREIQKTAAALGYQPNAAAAALAHFKRGSKVAPVQEGARVVELLAGAERIAPAD